MEADRSDLDEYEVFASYSRVDKSIVKPLVELMRAIGPSVFRDEDSIPPGQKWSVVLATAIENCRVVLVFWCAHSADSIEVEKEYLQAFNLEKTVIPVLLDNTTLHGKLAELQGVDMRTLDAHGLAPPYTPDAVSDARANLLSRSVHAAAAWLGARFGTGAGATAMGDIPTDMREDIVTAYIHADPEAERYAGVALRLYREIGQLLEMRD